MSSIIQHTKAEKLYQKLQTFQFTGSGAKKTFIDRLADENSWSKIYAKEVVEEYRRFLVLAIFADHPVTPSDQVDQAWHLHLLYSTSYWDELCGKVLGRPLHHQPTLGGKEEQKKYFDDYSNTLESYEQIFGEIPPKDIWPSPKDRFSDDIYFQRIDVRAQPKPDTKSHYLWKLGIIGFVMTALYFSNNSFGVALIVGFFLYFILFGESLSSGGDGAGGSSGSSGSSGSGSSGSSGCGGCGGG